ncbi:hypothetical protein D9M68_710210 [compost metagenome]
MGQRGVADFDDGPGKALPDAAQVAPVVEVQRVEVAHHQAAGGQRAETAVVEPIRRELRRNAVDVVAVHQDCVVLVLVLLDEFGAVALDHGEAIIVVGHQE